MACKRPRDQASSPLPRRTPDQSSIVPYPHTQRRIDSEPRWRPVDQYTSAELASKVRFWLTDDGSLTGRLIDLKRGDFQVQRLYQGWQVPLPSERRLLALPSRQLALVREVALLLAGQAVVFARSVFPISSLTGSLTHLRRLQNSSLGAILFKHPGMHRRPFFWVTKRPYRPNLCRPGGIKKLRLKIFQTFFR